MTISRGEMDGLRVHIAEEYRSYKVPVIRLTKETPKEAVCTVFEKVNTKGVQLTVFELLTATYAGDPDYFAAHGSDFQLPAHWQRSRVSCPHRHARESRTLTSCRRSASSPPTTGGAAGRRRPVHPASRQLQAQRHPRTCRCRSTFSGRPRSCPRCDWTADSSPGKGSSARPTFRTAARSPRSPPSAPCSVSEADTADSREKITRWYWCGVLGEQYGGSPDSRLPRDLEQVVGWVRGGRDPPRSPRRASPPPG